MNPHDLRRALGLFATGVTVVCALDRGAAEPRGMTANAFLSASLDPPLILVSVGLGAHLHAVLSTESAFSVSVLPESLEREARRFAGVPLAAHEPEPDFAWPGGVPVLEGALAWFTATVVARHRTGDHTLFVGQVREFATPDPEAPPLVFHRSQFASTTPGRAAPLATDPWGALLERWG